MSELPADSVVLATVPPCLLLKSGDLQDLTPAQIAQLPSEADFLTRLDQLADAAEEIGLALNHKPKNKKLLKALDEVSASVRALMRKELAGSPILRVMGLNEEDEGEEE